MLTDQELLRYSRHILLSDVDVGGQELIAKAHVLIAGLGGLGSPVAMYLAASGIGELTLVDYDHVDESNLQRQIVHRNNTVGQSKVDSAKEVLQQLNADIKINTIDAHLSSDQWQALINNADIVADCTDNFETRFLLNRHCYQQQKPLVSGAAIRFEGQLSVFDSRQPNSPCYQCLYHPDMNDDLRCAEAGVIAPLVGVIGSLQALEIIKLALNFKSELLGRLMIFDAKSHQWRSLRLPKDPHCAICDAGQTNISRR